MPRRQQIDACRNLAHALFVATEEAPMATSAVKVTGINHVVLHVRDMDRSLQFYMGVLGFEVRRIPDGPGGTRSFLRCGAQGLDLFQVDSDVHSGEEMNHMALEVDARDLDEVAARLTSAGIDASQRTTRNSLFIADPDGHRIEMLPLTANELEHKRKAADAAVN
jgi:catechol 2,3-dioxygenase-like lactoylglutathione lyase family enzyme